MRWLEILTPLIVGIIPTIVSIITSRNGTRKQLDALSKSFAKHAQEDRRYRLAVVWKELHPNGDTGGIVASVYDEHDWANIKELCNDYLADAERYPDLDGWMKPRAEKLKEISDTISVKGVYNDDK